MKWIFMIVLAFLVILLFGLDESAYAGHKHYHFDVRISTSFWWTPSPAPSYYRSPYHPHYRYYYPPYPHRGYYYRDYYPPDYRIWVPGHWDWEWTPYGWRQVWVPGYWRWKYHP